MAGGGEAQRYRDGSPLGRRCVDTRSAPQPPIFRAAGHVRPAHADTLPAPGTPPAALPASPSACPQPPLPPSTKTRAPLRHIAPVERSQPPRHLTRRTSSALRNVMAAELDLAGLRVGMIHDAGPREGRLARLRRRFPGIDLVVFGHSHIPLQASDGNFRIFNPGSPTDKRRQSHRTSVSSRSSTITSPAPRSSHCPDRGGRKERLGH
jgi:hypothetical protein